MKSYFQQIKTIYIDPPYNTGKDFVYKDNLTNGIQAYLEQTGQTSGGVKLTNNPDSSGRFHSDWISMMYSRLSLSRNLLKKDGVIFVSIDNNELHNLRRMMDDIFHPTNFLGVIVWETATDNNATQVATEHEYIVCYAKDKSEQEDWEIPSEKAHHIQEKYAELLEKIGNDPEKIQDNLTKWIRSQIDSGEIDLSGVSHYHYVDEKGVYYPGNSANPRAGGYDFDIIHPKTKEVCAKPENGYRWPATTFNQALERGDDHWGDDHTIVPKIKKRLETATALLKSVYYEDNRRTTKELTKLMGAKVFDNPKSHRLLSQLFEYTTTKDDIILDFFAGSCSTVEAIFNLNLKDGGERKFICIQLPELCNEKSIAKKQGFKNIAEIGKERIRRVSARFADEIKNKKIEPKNSLDLGFKVFKQSKSNLKIWENYPGTDENELKKQMKLFESPLISTFIENDVLYEFMIKSGLNLNSKIEKLTIKSNVIFKISDEQNVIYVNLEKEIKSNALEEFELNKKDIFICIDNALNDSQKINLSKQCKLKTV